MAQALAQFPAFNPKSGMLEQILNFEQLVSQYESSSGHTWKLQECKDKQKGKKGAGKKGGGKQKGKNEGEKMECTKEDASFVVIIGTGLGPRDCPNRGSGQVNQVSYDDDDQWYAEDYTYAQSSQQSQNVTAPTPQHAYDQGSNVRRVQQPQHL